MRKERPTVTSKASPGLTPECSPDVACGPASLRLPLTVKPRPPASPHSWQRRVACFQGRFGAVYVKKDAINPQTTEA